MSQSAIGRYIERKSTIHSLDARAKSICLLLMVLVCLSVHSLWALGLVLALFLAAVELSGLSLRVAIGSARLLLLFFLLAAAFNFVFWQPEQSAGFFVMPHPRVAGLLRGAWVGARLILMISFVNLFLLSTAPEACAEAVTFFLFPLRRIFRGVASVPIVVMIALGFVPLVLGEGNRILMAQRARGMRVEHGLAGKIRELRPLIVPLFRSVILRADQLSIALEVRCFDPLKPRKSAFARDFGVRDAAAVICAACVLVLVSFLG